MIKILKLLFWDLKDRWGRLGYYNGILRTIPGRFGIELRSTVLSNFFSTCGEGVIIYEGVRFRGIHKLQVGNNVRIGVDNFIQASGGVILEDDVMLGPGVKIWTINHKFDDTNIPIYEQGYSYESVVIGKGCWLGANVFVLPGVHIPEGCVVTACSLVSKKKYPPYSILSGNPCRVIGRRTPVNEENSAR